MKQESQTVGLSAGSASAGSACTRLGSHTAKPHGVLIVASSWSFLILPSTQLSHLSCQWTSPMALTPMRPRFHRTLQSGEGSGRCACLCPEGFPGSGAETSPHLVLRDLALRLAPARTQAFNPGVWGARQVGCVWCLQGGLPFWWRERGCGRCMRAVFSGQTCSVFLVCNA